MTISELGSLGEVVGAFGLIVTIVFLAMEMRMKRQNEIYNDVEKAQIRSQELEMLVAQNPALTKVMTKWNKLIGGHLQPLPKDITAETIQTIFDEEESTILYYYLHAQAYNTELVLTKAERGAVSEKAMKQLDPVMRASAEYLTVFGHKFYPRRLKEKYLDGLT